MTTDVLLKAIERLSWRALGQSLALAAAASALKWLGDAAAQLADGFPLMNALYAAAVLAAIAALTTLSERPAARGATRWLQRAIFLPPAFYAAAALIPITVARHTITDGTRVVIFQDMIHIGSAGFYQAVAADVSGLTRRGYRLFYEEMESGDLATEKALEQVAFHESWAADAALGGLVGQDERLFVAAAAPGSARNVDMTLEEMARRFGTLQTVLDSERVYRQETAVACVSDDHDPMLDPRVRRMRAMPAPMRAVSQWLHRAQGRAIVRWLEIFPLPPEKDDAVVVDGRNAILAEAIEAANGASIVVLYGADHWAGTFADLKRRDPRWREIGVSRRIAY